jgi:hypothetical protein
VLAYLLNPTVDVTTCCTACVAGFFLDLGKRRVHPLRLASAATEFSFPIALTKVFELWCHVLEIRVSTPEWVIPGRRDRGWGVSTAWSCWHTGVTGSLRVVCGVGWCRFFKRRRDKLSARNPRKEMTRSVVAFTRPPLQTDCGAFAFDRYCCEMPHHCMLHSEMETST